MNKCIASAAAIIALLSTHAMAQTTEKNPLARVKSLKCKFTVYAVKQSTLSLDVDEIDTDNGTARVTGTSGPVHVTALLTVSSLHFMERTVTGTLNVTTVFVPGSNAQKLRAVLSRHDYLPMSIPGFTSEPTVSQNYGFCEAGQ